MGLAPLLPIWINIIIGILILGFLFWMYSNLNYRKITLPKKILLVLLRFIPVIILFTLLLNPFSIEENKNQHKPNLLILQDTSSSIGVITGQYKGRTTANSIYNRIYDLKQSFAELEIYFFSDKTTLPVQDNKSPRFEGFSTDIYKQLEQINYYSALYDAAILISDGIHTYGKNPFFFNNQIKLPTYVLGLGDTTITSDLFIQKINTNRKAYINQPHPIDVEVQSFSMTGDTIKIQLYQDNNLEEIYKTKIESQNQTITHRFTITPSKEGHLPLKIAIVPHDKEWNKDNNEENLALFVQKYHTKIIHFAFTISADIRAFRQVLSSYENFQWHGRTWNGTKFIEGTLDETVREADLYVFHGIPPQSILSSIKDIVNGSSTIFFRHENEPHFNSNLFQWIPMPLFDSTSQYKKGWMEIGSSKIAQIITKPLPVAPRSLPPLYFNSTETTQPNWTSIIHTISLETNPIIWTHQKANSRHIAITAQDWYKWIRHQNSDVSQWSYTLFSNIILWCVEGKNNDPIQIVLPKSTFSIYEPIPLSAYFTNTFEHSKATETLQLNIYKNDVLHRQLILRPHSDNTYQTEISPLEQGIYGLKLVPNTIDKNNQNTSITYINVQITPIEYKNTRRNDPLLKSIAQHSNGFYYPYNQIDFFLQQLKEEKQLTSQKYTDTSISKKHFINNYFWFIIVLVLMATNWILSKHWLR